MTGVLLISYEPGPVSMMLQSTGCWPMLEAIGHEMRFVEIVMVWSLLSLLLFLAFLLGVI